MDDEVLAEAETVAKYEGYLKRQERLVARSAHLESAALPEGLDYAAVAGLTREAVEKLTPRAPAHPGPGLAHLGHHPPAAVTCLEIHLAKLARGDAQAPSQQQ